MHCCGLLQAQPEFVWAKEFKGNKSERWNSIVIGHSGNIYSSGFFNDTVDFDPGPGQYNLVSAKGNSDIFICKQNTSGSLLWVKQLTGPDFIAKSNQSVDDSGNVYISGTFSGTVDFDPGIATNYLTSSSMDDIFIVKLDSSGNFLWVKKLDGPSQNRSWVITFDHSGSICIAGFFYSTTDFDPGPGIYRLNTIGGQNPFILKLDASGNFIWVKQFISNTMEIFSLTTDAKGNIYTTGEFKYSLDFDPGPGSFNLSASGSGSADIFISKLNTDGNFVWAKRIGGQDEDWGYAIAADNDGNIYCAGNFQKLVDFDPGPATYNFTAFLEDMFILKLDSSGNFKLAKQIKGIITAQPFCLCIGYFNDIYITGFFYGPAIDFDPGIGVYN